MSVTELITQVVSKGNEAVKPELVSKNAQHLKSFKENNREGEYQAYVNRK